MIAIIGNNCPRRANLVSFFRRRDRFPFCRSGQVALEPGNCILSTQASNGCTRKKSVTAAVMSTISFKAIIVAENQVASPRELFSLLATPRWARPGWISAIMACWWLDRVSFPERRVYDDDDDDDELQRQVQNWAQLRRIVCLSFKFSLAYDKQLK